MVSGPSGLDHSDGDADSARPDLWEATVTCSSARWQGVAQLPGCVLLILSTNGMTLAKEDGGLLE